ncbi:hypothetical protein BC834DRAFT_53242 [Gloeopeniophorella convolvens]|nr:hypothetical protein BC834DRAFT_53242 [Gloeopeniophorella convolvens]
MRCGLFLRAIRLPRNESASACDTSGAPGAMPRFHGIVASTWQGVCVLRFPIGRCSVLKMDPLGHNSSRATPKRKHPYNALTMPRTPISCVGTSGSTVGRCVTHDTLQKPINQARSRAQRGADLDQLVIHDVSGRRHERTPIAVLMIGALHFLP